MSAFSDSSLIPDRIDVAGNANLQSVHAPAGSVQEESAEPLIDALIVAPPAFAARR